MWATSAAPVDADTIGGTTGISQAGRAARSEFGSAVIIANGTQTAVATPIAVPAAHSTPLIDSATAPPRIG